MVNISERLMTTVMIEELKMLISSNQKKRYVIWMCIDSWHIMVDKVTGGVDEPKSLNILLSEGT